ncbi:A/G-specific adenine glycosylase [Anaerosolibacter carboniphilus]|uniref:Adenine DNA glycosylase n=1 Tax=Anaerosolibacter carboniphilus TaxID=1417629 RepID=A0A841KQL5_9FIRM|nr:A/G-specific adenine glycosylase [Anaerosolibacter carboniphilus]MBB6215776.1 A/G-specific adenine glycosylase [Anaerosolibacter carboniphilus]
MVMYKADDWKDLDRERILCIQKQLIDWYEKNHRKLPWRETRDPYHIWVSEVMLQQTRVDTVIPYFLNFIGKFPTIEVLAQAHEEEVLKAWEGLGYYSRVRNLQRGAKVVMSQYGGLVPKELQEIKKIPGIGPYTAGAILSIAYDKAVPAVDGNVMRVFSRLFCIDYDISDGKTRREMEQIGNVVVPEENPSFFNQGLMELGALICTPLSPKCIACPVYGQCRAAQKGIQNELPIKKKKQAVKEVELEVALAWKEDKVLLMKRPTEGLLASLWTFPSAVREEGWEPGNSIIQELKEQYGMTVENIAYLFDAHHVFTHLKWNMKVYGCNLASEEKLEYPQVQWVTLDEIKDYAIPTAFKKVLNKIKR